MSFANALRPSLAICLKSSIFQVISQIFNEIWVWVLARSYKDCGTFLKLDQCWLGEMPRKTVLLRHKSLPQSEAFGSLTKEFAYLTPVIARQSSHVCLLCSTMLPPQVLKWGWCSICDELRLITQMTSNVITDPYLHTLSTNLAFYSYLLISYLANHQEMEHYTTLKYCISKVNSR